MIHTLSTNLENLQMNEQLYNNLINYLTTLTYPTDYDDSRKTHLRKLSTQHFVINHTLYRKGKKGKVRVIKRDEIEPILYHLHRDIVGAHLGINAVFEKVKERYYWPQMFDDIREYVQTCDICQRRGPPERKEPLIPLTVKEPFHQIGIDVKGPLPRTSTGNRYIIVAMDYFTKWPEARAVKDMKADTIAKFIFEEIICRHGVPQIMISDRGTSFVNRIIDKLCEDFQLKHRLTSPYRPQTNGMVERFNRTLGESIAKLVQDGEKEWDHYVDATLFAYRTKVHKTTGHTPFYLMYGRQATLPIELKIPIEKGDNTEDVLMERLYHLIDTLEEDRQEVVQRVQLEQVKQKNRHDQQKVSKQLQIGEKVLVERTWLKTNFSSKLEDKWTGPYFVHEAIGDNVYKLRTMEGKMVKNVVHGNRLKLYKERTLEPYVVINL
jgi:hypothetical protein